VRLSIFLRLIPVLAIVAGAALLPRGLSADRGGPHLDNIFVIILENHDYCQILAAPASAVSGECATGDNPNPAVNAPFLNQLAGKNGVATAYYGTSHPSEPNYVSMVGGNWFGISDDDDYACPNGPSPNSVGCHEGLVAGSPGNGPNYANHTIYGPNLASQMDDHGVSWKGYFQGLPSAGATGNCYPSNGSNCLYASKHNPFINFESVQDKDLSKNVPIDQFATDLKNGSVPKVSVIVPDQCNDMHGLGGCTTANIDMAGCTVVGGCKLPCTSDPGCIQDADAYTNTLVSEIRASNTWKHGNDAIIITVDEGNTNLGCCDAGTSVGGGGGNVATIVVTNHDARHPDQDNDGFADSTPYNHYSLMATIEDAYGLGCAQNTCDSANVKPMTPLFRDP
jgi:phosphatidylinositol-3-phosphatase